MESTVIYRDRQELQSGDLNATQDFARASLDHVVADAVDGGRAYVGFEASKTGATEITLSPGRLYALGAVYPRPEDTVIDLFNHLPLVTKRRVAIVAWGQQIDTDTQPRDFLIDAEAGTTEPQSVAMENRRRTELAAVAGSEAPDPGYPATDANVTVIAYITLDTTGVTGVEQWGATKLTNLRALDKRTVELEGWRGQISGQVDTLRTDLSALADGMGSFALKAEVAELTANIDELREEVDAPGAYALQGIDYFLTDAGSHTGHGDFDAVIDEGIQFPATVEQTSALALLNVSNPHLSQGDGFALPKHTHAVRLDMKGYTGEVRMAQFTYETTTLRKMYRSRRRLRFGFKWRRSRSAARWLGTTSSLAHAALRRRNETWSQIAGRPDALRNGQIVANGLVHWQRFGWFWYDTYTEPYWEKVTETASVAGQQIAQTFLSSQDGWLTQLGLYFTRKAESGDVTVLIAETAFGMPDLSRVIAQTTLPVGDIKVGAESGGSGLPSIVETKVSMPATYLSAGKRYAVVCVTAGDHYVATTNSDNGAVQGTFFVSTDGAFFQGNLTDDMKMRLYYAKFERTRVSVELSPLQLSGGITEIDILHEGTVPPSCRLDFEVQVSGAWVALEGEPDGPDLSGMPAILPMRATMTGTTDLMPGIGLSGSEVVAARQKTSFAWVGQERTLGSNASSVKVVYDLQGYDDNDHGAVPKLLTGASLNNEETADVIEDVVLADGTTRRSAYFNGLSASVYAAKLEGATSSAASLFHVSAVSDFVQF